MALKRGGRLLPAGRGFLAALAAVALFWGHSAFVHAHAALGERDFARRRRAARGFLDPDRRDGDDDRRRAGPAARRPPTPGDGRTLGAGPRPFQALRLAWLSAIFGDRAELERYAALALARNEAPAEVHQLVARDAWRRGDAARAAAAYERAIAAAPDEPAPYLGLGVLAARTGDLDAARAAFDRGRGAPPRLGGSRLQRRPRPRPGRRPARRHRRLRAHPRPGARPSARRVRTSPPPAPPGPPLRQALISAKGLLESARISISSEGDPSDDDGSRASSRPAAPWSRACCIAALAAILATVGGSDAGRGRGSGRT